MEEEYKNNIERADLNKETYKIAAVVVTYNRLKLLKECIEAIRNQTRKLDEIIVVNNSSTDGTKEWLEKQGDITSITQENFGGAGGFYTGIKTAYEKGYDWIWCMDDDGFLKFDALEKLITCLEKDKQIILNSLVVSKEDNQKLSFGLYDSIHDIFCDRRILLKSELIEGQANFFNGTLLPKDFVKNYGLPLKALYIRGDEFEYFLRARLNHVLIITVTNSIIYHPAEKYILIENFMFRYKFLFMDEVKRYYTIRNMIILKKLYNQVKQESVFKRIILDLLYSFVHQGLRNTISSIFKGIIDGITVDLKQITNQSNVE